jgi:hypothetical protein
VLFVALFLATFGRFDPSDRCLVYFSVLHDLVGRFKDQQTLGKGGLLASLIRNRRLRSVAAVDCAVAPFRPSKRLTATSMTDATATTGSRELVPIKF